MGVELSDRAGRTLKINAWNWGVLHYTLECAEPPLFDDEEFTARLRCGGVQLDGEQITLINEFLTEVVLPRIPPGQRMLYDFSTTSEPDDGTFHREQPEMNYSLHHDVLARVIEFLGGAQPPVDVM